MHRFTARALLAGFLFSLPLLGGCVVGGYARPNSLVGGGRCHPSQYWDGYGCRHKGKGKGKEKGKGHKHHGHHGHHGHR